MGYNFDLFCGNINSDVFSSCVGKLHFYFFPFFLLLYGGHTLGWDEIPGKVGAMTGWINFQVHIPPPLEPLLGLSEFSLIGKDFRLQLWIPRSLHSPDFQCDILTFSQLLLGFPNMSLLNFLKPFPHLFSLPSQRFCTVYPESGS